MRFYYLEAFNSWFADPKEVCIKLVFAPNLSLWVISCFDARTMERGMPRSGKQ